MLYENLWKEYYEAIYLMPPIAAGIFFTSFYNLFSNVLLYYKKTKLIMIATFIATITNVILNYIFIQIYGYIAAAYTTLVAFLILAIIQFVFMRIVLEGKKLFNDRFLWSIAATLVLISFFVNFLYNNDVMRYLVIVLLIIGLILKRRYFIRLIQDSIIR